MAEIPSTAPAVLVALHGLVVASIGPASLVGTIAVGVRGGGSAHWWSAHFDGDSVRATFDDDMPPADAWLLLGNRSADALLRGGPLSPSDLDVGGDEVLLDRFLSRYSEPMRAWQTAGQP